MKVLKPKKAIYPGTFDPVTLGHIDIIKRATEIFDEVIVAVSNSSNKKTVFTIDERVKMIRWSVEDIKKTRVESFSGLLVDYISSKGAKIIIRGLRSSTDFDYEQMMAFTNKKLNNRVETIFLMSAGEYSFISSSLVREIASYGGKIDKFVPEATLSFIKKKFLNL